MSVYLIQGVDGGLVKIGWTEKRLRDRFRQIQNMSPVELCVLAAFPQGNQSLETQLHIYYKAKRRWGEWFELSREEISECQAFLGTDGDQESIESALVLKILSKCHPEDATFWTFWTTYINIEAVQDRAFERLLACIDDDDDPNDDGFDIYQQNRKKRQRDLQSSLQSNLDVSLEKVRKRLYSN